jgi:3-carboxy-cis,cis-muconate cycloisomerase
MTTESSLWASAPRAIADVTDGAAWIAALLEVEVALAGAQEDAGLLPAGTARAIGAAAKSLALDPAALRDAGVHAGTPVIPLVAALSTAAGNAGGWVHHGATSQDVIDTALALVARRAEAVLRHEVAWIARALAALAAAHRHSVMPGRTLLQHGAPTTFGLKAAGWLVAVIEAHEGLRSAVDALPVQLGGAVGTRAVLGDRADAVVAGLAERLGLPAAPLPWHANRIVVARLGAALGIAAGAHGKIAGDLVLLAQTEVAEVAERREPGRGTSSAMPQKRNPSAAIEAVAAARRATPLAAALLGDLDHAHERAAGAWQAEAPLVVELFGRVAQTAAALARALDGLEVDAARMRANLDPAGAWASDALAAALAPELGRAGAHAAVRDLLAGDLRAARHRPVFDALRADPLAAAGPVDALVDRALARCAASVLAS